jgi:septal ring-binding cell division protein DamX
MSAVADPREAERSQSAQVRCENCGSPMDADQEWCLQCGAARTLIHRAPDWRIAAAIVATVVVLVLAGFAIALINLSSDANRSAASTPAAVSTTAQSTTSHSTSRAAGSIPGWPIGLPGWTVVVFSSTSQSAAQAKAKSLIASGLHVGLLSTSQHPSTNMNPGHYVVFIGRYATRDAAAARATSLHAQGYRARARLVGLPGSP